MYWCVLRRGKEGLREHIMVGQLPSLPGAQPLSQMEVGSSHMAMHEVVGWP